MSNNVKDWNPTRKDDIDLKKALLALQESTASVLLSPSQQKEEDEQQKKFILQGQSYFALKAYVMTGKEFPENDSAFEKEFPEKAFARIVGFDKNIRTDTQKSLVPVGSSCNAFYRDKLQNIVSAGSLAVTWSTATMEYLTDNEDTNLYDYLMVLSDIKYQTLEDRDEAFHEALLGARGCLKLLAHQAQEGSNKAEAFRNDLDHFRDKTKELQPGMKTLIGKYTAGDRPLLPFLNAEHQKKVDEEWATLANYNSTYEEWKTATGAAVTVGVSIGWIPIFGWVPLALLSHNAKELENSYKRLWNSWKALKEENEAEAKLIVSINNMVNRFDGLEKKIQDAMDAIQVLKVMFDEQHRSYELVRASLSGMGLMANEEDGATRRMFLKGQIKGTKENLQRLMKAAAGFVEAILTETNLG